MITAYGRQFNTDSLLSVELLAFREGWTTEQGGLGRTTHFINIVKEIWPEFEWYSWAHEQAEALCEHKVSGFTSGASSSKSDLMAKYGLVSWYCDPVNTLVIICSTTAIDAKMRIFGHVIRDHRKARASKKSVGKLVESQSIIKLSESEDGLAASDNSSVCLVAAGDQYKDDALRRLEGRKNKRVLLLIDEGQDVSQTIIDAALWNLSANAHFEVHMAGNASRRDDPHGLFMKPIEGWNSINRTTHKWKIKVGGREGIGIHFDATADDSPNMQRFAQGQPQLPFLRKSEDIISAKTHLGENNPVYLRQFVGFWSMADDETHFIIVESVLASHEAYDRAVWRNPPIDLAGIDPSYSGEGDRFIFHHCKWGLSVHEIWTFEYFEAIQIKPTLISGETKDDGNIRVCKNIAEKRSISPRFIGMDASAGSPLLSIAHRTWSPEILGVPFGGAATDLTVSQFDKRIASDLYANAVSELWYVLVEFLVAGQVRGVTPELSKELTARMYALVAGGKIKVEKKSEMKKRLGFSPDLADSGAVALRVLRERLHVKAGAHSAQAQAGAGDWKAVAARLSVSTATDAGPAKAKTMAEQALHHVEANRQGLLRLAKMLHRG